MKQNITTNVQSDLFALPDAKPVLNAGAEFSECGLYRYKLWRIWDESLPLAMCIGLNPSTANAVKTDPTITFSEVPQVVSVENQESQQAVEGATPVVQQNEQTKEVCQIGKFQWEIPHCNMLPCQNCPHFS